MRSKPGRKHGREGEERYKRNSDYRQDIVAGDTTEGDGGSRQGLIKQSQEAEETSTEIKTTHCGRQTKGFEHYSSSAA